MALIKKEKEVYEFIKKHPIYGFEAVENQKIDKRIKDAEEALKKKQERTNALSTSLNWVDNNDTVSNGFIWFHLNLKPSL